MSATPEFRPLAVVTGASSGIGYELACEAARRGFDLVIAADRSMSEVTRELQSLGASVEAVQVDLATMEGVRALCETIQHRQVAALLANAGHGLGEAFLSQDFAAAKHVVDTNIIGTIYLIHLIGNHMRKHDRGRILITGSVAGFKPGTFQAVYNGTKAFIDSFSWALREELRGTGITVTCLMPGVTDTDFFERAGLTDTATGASDKKMDPAEVARIGFDAMMEGTGDVIAGWKNKLKTALAQVTPASILAEKHRKTTAPGSAGNSR